jgi:hypothetical protein
MRIAIRPSEPNAFVLSFDETEIKLSRNEVKALLLELTRTLLPEGSIVASPRERAQALIRRVSRADNVGIQRLFGVARHDDLLVLLKLAEGDEALKERLFGNMSERSRKIFVEDLSFRFSEGLPDEQIGSAVDRLARAAKRLEEDGSLTTAKTGKS